MQIARTEYFKRSWKELNEEQKALARKAIDILTKDLHYPSLRVKKIKGTGNIWEARVSLSLRITFQIDSDVITLRNIGKHDETLRRPQEVQGMPTYSKVTRNGQITLPARVRKKLGIEEGDLIEIEVKDEMAILLPKKLIDKSQAYFWTKKWQEGENEADENIKAGRVKVYDSAEALIKDLE
jgi:AbrB family looped-hinge helix DNA binding protein